MSLSRRLFLLSLVLVSWVSAHPAALAADGRVTVFAAASLKNAFDAVAERYRKETGKTVVLSYAASGALAKQIEQGAPADVFVSADLKWMDYVETKALVKPESRVVIAANTLVLAVPADSTATITLAAGADLAGLIGDGRLAIGEAKSVPAGRYAEEALKALGLWAEVEGKLAPVENVRAALALVSTGEAPAGLVYATDAEADPKVKVAATFPEGSHAPIVYPAALTTAAGPDAAAFLAYVTGPVGKEILAAGGFAPAP